MKLTRTQLALNAVFCLTLLGVIIWALYAEYNRPWKEYQKKFKQLSIAKSPQPLFAKEGDTPLNPVRLSSRRSPLNRIEGRIPLLEKGDGGGFLNGKIKIKQLWLKELGETDRCITCHLGIDKSGFNEEPQPYKAHSGDYIRHHPVERFGCVVCHDGQGAALTVKDAHGEVKNWSRPVLKGYYAQSSCGKCHFMGLELPLSSKLDGASMFIEGWRLFKEYNCIGCHKLAGDKRPARIGPALTLISSKVNRAWLVKWLRKPKDYLPNAKMPAFKLSDEEIGYIADYLMEGVVSSKNFKNPPSSPFIKGGLILSPSLAKRGKGRFLDEGKTLVSSLGCLGCHIINKKGNGFAPDLSGIGNKVKPEWLFQFLKKPKNYDPKTIIPDLAIQENEIESIAAYLMSLKKDKHDMENPPTSPFVKGGFILSPSLAKRGKGRFYESKLLPENIEKGRRLVKELGCTGCHVIENFPLWYDAPELNGIGSKRIDEVVFNNVKGAEKTLINWLKIKVMNPERFAAGNIVTRMPNYGFNKEQTEAIVAFLLSIKRDSVSPEYIKTLIDPESAEMRGKKTFERYNCAGCHRMNNEGGGIGPDLTKEAKKSRPEWLFSFFKKPYKLRPSPILKAAMPDFNLFDKEGRDIIEYLAFVSKEPYPYLTEQKKKADLDDIRAGEKLYHEIFACIGCHIVNGFGGQIGPEHTDAASRLRRQWIEQWLKNPQSIQPDVRMPRFKFKDWELKALTDYLMTLGGYRFIEMKGID